MSRQLLDVEISRGCDVIWLEWSDVCSAKKARTAVSSVYRAAFLNFALCWLVVTSTATHHDLCTSTPQRNRSETTT